MFQEITPVGSGISSGSTNEIRCYREGDYGAMHWNNIYTSTIRSVNCKLLSHGGRCSHYVDDRQMLKKRHQRAEEKMSTPPMNYVHSSHKHRHEQTKPIDKTALVIMMCPSVCKLFKIVLH